MKETLTSNPSCHALNVKEEGLSRERNHPRVTLTLTLELSGIQARTTNFRGSSPDISSLTVFVDDDDLFFSGTKSEASDSDVNVSLIQL
jgi:hypothetical protein